MITFSIALLVAALVLGALSKFYNDDWIKPTSKAVAVIAIIIGVPAMIGASYRSVPAGNRGVLLRFSAVAGDLTEGAHFITPFIDDVSLVNVQTQKAVSQASAASKDLQTVQTEVVVNYHISPQSAAMLYRRVGLDYDNRVIQPAVQEVVKSVVAQYTAEDLIRQRAEVKALVDTGLSTRLGAYDIVVEPNGVSLTNFDFSPQFNQAIEAKQVAEQTAEKQKYVLQQAQLEAQTAVTQARGEAEATRIRAATLNDQGGSKVLAQQWIQRWDGKLPTVSGGGQQIINLSDLMSSKK